MIYVLSVLNKTNSNILTFSVDSQLIIHTYIHTCTIDSLHQKHLIFLMIIYIVIIILYFDLIVCSSSPSGMYIYLNQVSYDADNQEFWEYTGGYWEGREDRVKRNQEKQTQQQKDSS